jgi:hypothetical protein
VRDGDIAPTRIESWLTKHKVTTGMGGTRVTP